MLKVDLDQVHIPQMMELKDNLMKLQHLELFSLDRNNESNNTDSNFSQDMNNQQQANTSNEFDNQPQISNENDVDDAEELPW